MENLDLQMPVAFDLQVYITDGKRSGVATITMGKGRVPTDDEVRQQVTDFMKSDSAKGFKLMTKREFFDFICEEATGLPTRFALPGADEFERPINIGEH
jgi:hypothetical protein